MLVKGVELLMSLSETGSGCIMGGNKCDTPRRPAVSMPSRETIGSSCSETGECKQVRTAGEVVCIQYLSKDNFSILNYTAVIKYPSTDL